MNLTSALLLIFFLSASLFSSAQNLISNPDFEQYNACPATYNELSRLDNWAAGNYATPDYFNCGFSGSFVQGTPSQGTGVVGLWGGPNHPSCSGSGYAENLISTLSQSITPGKQYLLSFDIQIDQGIPNDCMQFGFYFFNAATAPTLIGLCAPSVSPQYSVAGSALQQGSYTHFEFFFSPTDTYDQVLISPFTTSNTTTPSCASYSSNKMYLNLDNLSLTEQILLPLNIQNFTATPQHSDILLRWEIDKNHDLDYLEVQRSSGISLADQAFQSLAVLSAQQCDENGLYEYLDQDVEGEIIYYRIKVVDMEGAISYSPRISARNAQTGSQVAIYPNPSSGQFRIQLDMPEEDLIQWTVLDLMGKQICQQSSSIAKGIQEISVHLPSFAAGQYLLRVEMSDGASYLQQLLIL